MLAGAQGLEVDLIVRLDVGGVDEQVDPRPGQHLVQVGVDLRHAEFGGQACGAARNRVAHGDKLGLGERLDARAIAAVSDDPTTDQPNLYLFHLLHSFVDGHHAAAALIVLV